MLGIFRSGDGRLWRVRLCFWIDFDLRRSGDVCLCEPLIFLVSFVNEALKLIVPSLNWHHRGLEAILLLLHLHFEFIDLVFIIFLAVASIEDIFVDGIQIVDFFGDFDIVTLDFLKFQLVVSDLFLQFSDLLLHCFGFWRGHSVV